MSLASVGDPFGVTKYNYLKTLGFSDSSAMGEKEVRMHLDGNRYKIKTSVSSVETPVCENYEGLAYALQIYGGL